MIAAEAQRIDAQLGTLAVQPTGHPCDLERLPNVEAVLWDIYGTLLISGCGDVGTVAETSRDAAMQAALESCGLKLRVPPVEMTDALDAIVRDQQATQRSRGAMQPEVDIVAAWASLLQQAGDDAAVVAPHSQPIEPRRLSLEFELRANPVAEMPGATQVLMQLADRGLVQGIVSNAQFFTPLIAERVLGKSFEALGIPAKLQILSYRYLRAKPDPLLFELVVAACAQLGIGREGILYVGNDMRNDVAAAQKAGLRAVLFAGDIRSLRLREGDSFVAGHAPEATIVSLDQLPPLLA